MEDKSLRGFLKRTVRKKVFEEAILECTVWKISIWEVFSMYRMIDKSFGDSVGDQSVGNFHPMYSTADCS